MADLSKSAKMWGVFLPADLKKAAQLGVIFACSGKSAVADLSKSAKVGDISVSRFNKSAVEDLSKSPKVGWGYFWQQI